MQRSSGDDVLVLNGDTWFPLQADRFFLFHTGSKNSLSLALKPMKDFSRYGSVECSEDSVIRFNEKKFCREGLINGGIYVINRDFFGSLQLPEVFSLEADVLEKYAGSSLLKCMIFDEPFIDIGIPEDYERAGVILKGE
jgi:D-glycero-alpha-D-manno-heptose 1-phosphate guanylyltransferase